MAPAESAESSRDEDPGSEVTLGGRIIQFTSSTAKKNSFSRMPGKLCFGTTQLAA
jgi:hypothetical protein